MQPLEHRLQSETEIAAVVLPTNTPVGSDCDRLSRLYAVKAEGVARSSPQRTFEITSNPCRDSQYPSARPR